MILDFDKPKKIRSTKEHNEMFQSDTDVTGTYVPNMSKKDMAKWKAKHIKGEDERIEIRKTLDSQLLIIVYKNPYNPKYPKSDTSFEEYKTQQKEWQKSHLDIRISMNGPCQLSFIDWNDLMGAVWEANEILGNGIIRLMEIPEEKVTPKSDLINFDEKWLIDKFYEVSEEEGNGETMEDPKFNVDDPKKVVIDFTLNCGRYGVWRGNQIIITPDSIRPDFDDIIEGGDIECNFIDAIKEKLGR